MLLVFYEIANKRVTGDQRSRLNSAILEIGSRHNKETGLSLEDLWLRVFSKRLGRDT